VGAGLLNNVVGETDDAGKITLYWSTPSLPAASLGTSSGGSFTAGADQTGTSFVQAYSGVLSQTFTVQWTVQGQQAP